MVFRAAWVGGGDPWLLLTILRVISMPWVRWCVALLFLPLVGGLVGGAGGVCSPAVVASLALSSMGAPWGLLRWGLCAGVLVVVLGSSLVGSAVACLAVVWVFLVLVPGAGVRWFRACLPWLMCGRPVVLVVSVVPGVGTFPSAVRGSVVICVASVAV